MDRAEPAEGALKAGPRTKLAALAALFALPIAISFFVYHFARPEPNANYGELIAPHPVTAQPLERPGGGRFVFQELAGRWILVASDSGACAQPCLEKLVLMRQVRLALGRNASRVERVLVVDDVQAPSAAVRNFEGLVVALTPRGESLSAGAGNDRAHIYLVDPHGNVMLRWPAAAQGKRMLKDIERLLKASQIG